MCGRSDIKKIYNTFAIIIKAKTQITANKLK